ncbi:hypothetical protein EI42_02152 [Thermosporothrix hazakensis]|jgi:hypothetical protein|uniref:Uncharacterized protein n=2 Tax=Thermosporothrix TaxID=768650 RepID=A0A326U956_THEHA|nr:hypothetical protein [Thermosporothrix hazakensis]PZW32125.1 hypothetical protein EI42_02152 [Thermosporothrix hazakensis]BBH91401.1 hypothetical protein KTC_61520 [Thermosporothrix sp. COM3]GCE49547.1 hypothetical protein KTH_44160 [Thermosporothrix hazakensis]
MKCSQCQFENAAEETHCQQCGAELATPSRGIVPVTSRLPAVLQNPVVPKSVAAGVGALALGVGLELLRRNLLSRLIPAAKTTQQALPVLNEVKDTLFPQSSKQIKLPKGYEMQESVVYIRRIIRKESKL